MFLIVVNHQIACQFWIIIFCKAISACSRIDLSSLYLAFSIIRSLIWNISITLNRDKVTLFLLDRICRILRYHSRQSQHSSLSCYQVKTWAIYMLTLLLNHFIVIVLEFKRILLPESFIMNWTPFQTVWFYFLHILIKRAQDSDIALENNSDLFYWVYKLFILDVALEDGIYDLKKTVINQQLQASMIFLDVFEDHESYSCDFLSWNFLKNLTNSSYHSQLRNGNEFLYSSLQERYHPEIKQTVVYQLNVISTSVQALQK